MLSTYTPSTKDQSCMAFRSEQATEKRSAALDAIVGQSSALKRVVQQVIVVAPTDSTVLIEGETGTGKELVARALHALSRRQACPFQRVNCGAIPRDLLESDLFGHEKGAFTGALIQKMGRFEIAGQGTIFLDEIGELPLDLQPKLLRVLQEREFERLGSARTLPMHARVVAATNRNLAEMIAEGKFREDLFYRLNVFPIQVPSLRERLEDVPLLVSHAVEQFATRMGKRIESVAPESMQHLTRYSWPGNIRELQNVIERAVVLCNGDTLEIDETWLKRDSARPSAPAPLVSELANREKEIIEAALAESGGRIAGPSGAAVKLGIPRQTLDSKIASLQISKDRFKSRPAVQG